MSLFKKIWKDPVISAVIAGIILYLLSIGISNISSTINNLFYIPLPLWVTLALVFLSVTITRVIIFYSKANAKERTYKENIRREKEIETEEKSATQTRLINLSWIIFFGLNDRQTQLLIGLYNEKRDPENERIRIVPYSYLSNRYNEIVDKTNIPDETSFNSYYSCINSVAIGDNIIYEFNYYFYRLLKHYINTGKKEKL